MRHLWSLLAGLVVAPLTWLLVTLGQDGSNRTIHRWTEVGTFNTANLIEPAVYLGVAGILLGLLGTLRTSPLGPLTAGLLLIAPYVGMFMAPFTVRDRLPDGWNIFGDPLPLTLPVENGTLFLIGLLLLVSTFSVQRWRSWPRPAATTATTATTAGTQSSDDDTRTLTDWPPAVGDDLDRDRDRDTPPPSLGYPDPTPTESLPRRSGGESPWSTPPRGSGKRQSSGTK